VKEMFFIRWNRPIPIMVLCEICGARPARGRHNVEGAILSVCENCGRFGNPVREIILRKKIVGRRVEDEGPEVLPNYGEIIRKGREKLGLTQKELAARATERESVMVKIEQGEFIPSIPTAHKLEKVLGVRLIGSAEGPAEKKKTAQERPVSSGEGFTLGDLIKRKP
jgi:putative transcription factor